MELNYTDEVSGVNGENALFVTTLNVSSLNCGQVHAHVTSEGLQALRDRGTAT